MGWLSKIFSSTTVVEKAAEGLYNGIDKSFYTAEEKEGDQQKRIDMFMKLISITQDASPARRSIALVIMSFWMFLGFDVVFLLNISLLFPENSKAISEVLMAIMKFAEDYVMTPTSIVLGFYFLTQITKPFAPSKKEK